ncbi:ATP-binding SpoIIE family protein phosphatase [Streptomyces lavenduligriseus]|uniref:SpoIIE family protein phosphatase n=1 Tax=Streptomyces lavenduligriseus TaxID=67315 RepID=A0ABT0P377_9ACTN|nr:SpoIIE family protein phosphatase [Streptomyces lavenduligriseus]MCL3998048.1 SpoIIE family protein phosphatase [Streptomyces lavenduligriseus]
MERPATYTATATIDERGILTGWSDGARRLLGYDSPAVVGRPAAALLATDAAGARRTLAGRGRWHGTVPLRHQDGRRLELDVLAHRRTSPAGRTDWLVVSAVTARPQPPRGDPLEEWTFLQSPFPLAVFDPDLRLLRANRRLEHALALPEAAMRGLRLTHIVPGAASEEAERSMRAALESGRPQEAHGRLGPDFGRTAVLTPLKDADGRVRAVCLSVSRPAPDAAGGPPPAGGTGPGAATAADQVLAARELGKVTVPRLADVMAVDLLDRPRSGGAGGPQPGQVVLRRAALRAVPDGEGTRGTCVGETVVCPAGSPPARCLATARTLLYDTAEPGIAEWAALDPCAGWLRASDTRSLLAVPLVGAGGTLGVALFGRTRRRERFGPEDVRLAEEFTAKAAACIEQARAGAPAPGTEPLRHGLLPHPLPDQAALEITTRCLPAASGAGPGGDWFDVIPLSGARVALVAGDAAGRGIRASATVGRLRTAVRTLADVDLPADELLAHLDDLVLRLAADEGSADPATETAGGIGTTCLYAVYDPVSRRCTAARAGHPPPAVVTPDGAVRVLDVPAGPPLGLGGPPFEAVETELPEGSLLALYANGPDEPHGRVIGRALDGMSGAPDRPAPSLDSVCDRVVTELAGHRPDDRLSLLLARTRVLHEDRVACWELDHEPTVVSLARRYVEEQLSAWGLEEAVFTTELIVSELVTNAIRYGRPPVRLRLLRPGAGLICEVYDASGSTPHMRRARIFDEGGRGLLLVAQLAERWGTRHERTGKTVWAEQTPDGQTPAEQILAAL